MVPLYKFETDNDQLQDDSYFDSVVLSKKENDEFELKKSELLVEAYLYYEAIQELIVGKAISVFKKKDRQDKDDKKIDALKKLQKSIESFQECLMLVVFKELLFSCSEIQEANGNHNGFEIFEYLWTTVNGTESNDNPIITMEEASVLKAYFNKSELSVAESELYGVWESIINEFKRIEVMK